MLIWLFIFESSLCINELFYSVKKDGDSFTLAKGEDKTAILSMKIGSDSNKILWDKWEVILHSKSYSEDIPKALGFAEGAYFQPQIYTSYTNQMTALAETFEPRVLPQEFKQYYNNNYEWIKNYLKDHKDDAHCKYIAILLAQFEGIVEGYNKAAPENEKLSKTDLWIYQGLQDAHDAKEKFQPTTIHQGVPELYLSGSSSLLMKMEPIQKRDFYLGHSYFGSYSAAFPRMTKRVVYLLPTDKSVRVTMTGYPGQIASMDGLYVINKRKVVAEVRHQVLDPDYLKEIRNNGVFGWMRTMCANIETAEEKIEQWDDSYVQQTMYTDTKSVILIDFDKFTPGKGFDEGGVLKVESFIKADYAQDISKLINEKGYYAIFASPMSDEAYRGMRHQAYVEKLGEETGKEVIRFFSNDEKVSGKLKLYARLQEDVIGMREMKEILRRNHYTRDQEALDPKTTKPDPCMAFGARCEARSDPGEAQFSPIVAGGALDAKVISFRSVQHDNIAIAAGPAWDDTEPSLASPASSISALHAKRNFHHERFPANVSSGWTMLAFDGEGTQAIQIVLIISMVISGSLSVFGIVATIIYFVKKRIAKKNEGQKLLETPVNS